MMRRIFAALLGLFLWGNVFAELEILGEAVPSTLVFPPYLHSYGIRKATQAKLKVFLGPFAKFSDPQGLSTVRMLSRDDPTTEADDDEVVVYGVNSGKHQIIYNTSMYGIAAFGEKGSGDGQFLFPKGIAASEKGDVYIADTGNDRIVHLFNPKKEVTWAGAIGSKGSRLGEFASPEGVAVDSKGRIYVADTKNNRIQIFDKDGKPVFCFSGSGAHTLVRPTQIAVVDREEHWSYFRANWIFVIDQDHQRIQKFDFTGKCIAVAEKIPEAQYEYLCLDFYNQVYVTDFAGGRVIKYSDQLKVLDFFGNQGTGDRQFMEPRGITVWRRYGQMFVAEKDGAQYYWVGADARDVSLKKTGSQYELTCFFTEPVHVGVYAFAGADTAWLLRNRRAASGDARIRFPLKNEVRETGRLRIRMEPTYSSYTYIGKELERNPK